MSSEENVGSIFFAPVCSMCLNIIKGEVGFQEELVANGYLKKYTIEPYCCSKCGAIFKSIVAPKGLPFQFEYYGMEDETI